MADGLSVSIDIDSKNFGHSSKSGKYFIVIKTAKTPDPVYVVYDAGEMSKDPAFTGTAWMTDSKTQYMYELEAGKTPEHTVMSITSDALAAARAAGKEFDHWELEFFATATFDNEGVVTSLSNSIGKGNDQYPDDTISLPVYAKLTAVWKDVETIDLTVTKEWEDAKDNDGKRPDSITVQLFANGDKCGEPVEITEKNGWTYTFKDLRYKDNDGAVINYTVKELPVEGYTADSTEYTFVNGSVVITNSYTPETISIDVTKVWDDDNNRDRKQPESITVNLLANGQTLRSQTVSAETKWSCKFENLLKYENGGEEIEYTVSEADVPDGYQSVVTGSVKDGFVITNSYTPDTTFVYGVKTWEDNDDQDGIRPESITVNLLADGEKIASQVVTEKDQWTYAFNNLPVYKDGEEIVYTVTEDEVPGYTATIDGYDITNTHDPEKTSLSVSKVWNDNDNNDGIRPDSVEVVLLADGEEVYRMILSDRNQWSHTFTDLAKYSDGEEILYTIDEIAVDGYTATFTVSDNGVVITNTHADGTVDLTVEKVWDDSDDFDEVRPDAIEVQLFADGEKAGDPVSITAEDQWSYTFSGLVKYSDGEEIVYTVQEASVDGYTADSDEYEFVNGKAVITNTHELETVDVTVTKVWDDKDSADRPGSIQVQLYENGKASGDPVVLSAENGWTYTWQDLTAKSEWTVDEVGTPDGYTKSVKQDGTAFTITNTLIPPIDTPKTGGETNLTLWISLAVISIFGLTATAVLLGKKKYTV